MAAVDDLDVIRVTARMSLHGATLMNVFDFEARTDGDGENAGAAVTAIQYYMRVLYGYLIPVMSDQVSTVNLNAYNRTQSTDLGLFPWDTTGWGAALSSDPLPTGVAALITLPTSIGRTRGRKFFPGFAESTTVMGRYTAVAMTALSQAAVKLLTVVGPVSAQVNLNYVVVSEGVGAFTYAYPISANVSAIPAYQRRRKEGVGI